MPSLFDKVDQFWRGVGEPNQGGRGGSVPRNMAVAGTPSSASTSSSTSSSSKSRPPLPPSSSSKSKKPFSSSRVTGRPPIPIPLAATITTANGANPNGKFDRSRRCYSSLALNKACNDGGGSSGGNKSLSKNRFGSMMGGSIVDIYEFCKSQASRRMHSNSHSQAGRLKSLSKSSQNMSKNLSGSTMSICGYPCTDREVMSGNPAPVAVAASESESEATRNNILGSNSIEKYENNNTTSSIANLHNNATTCEEYGKEGDKLFGNLTKTNSSHHHRPDCMVYPRAISEGNEYSQGGCSCDHDDGDGVNQWLREGAFERLSDHPEIPCPEEEEKQTTTAAIPTDNRQQREDSEPPRSTSSEEALKMRWHKLGSSSSSFSDRRPKSFDYAQRKAWMKLYRDMEVSQASGSTSTLTGPRLSRPLTKGSITHLHLQEPSSSSTQDVCSSSSSTLQLDGGAVDPCGCEYEGDDTGSNMRSSADMSSTSPSLFKRFSKTFSLRFGSGSNVSKQPGADMHRKSKSSKGAIGSSPDLFNSRLEVDVSRDKVNGKMRKTNVKSVRGDKCQSGDSGIGMDEQQTEPHHRQISNLRRIRSDYISPSAASSMGISPAISSYASRAQANGSALAKLSLVEIPDHSWDENTSSSSPNGGSGTSDTASYEELVDAKLDEDDGFSSSDEGHHNQQQDQPPTYYHSLPHTKHNKRRLKEQGSTNSCGNAPQEDNSIRGKVVREIIHTEQNYVKTLNDIVQGFLNPCRARNDLFSSRTVQNIFSNIEEILRLHMKFLEALKSKVDPTFVSKSNVGGVFTSWADRFSLYSEYCCNNPISVATVRSLVQFPQYAEFFEACRRLQMMDKLPLHGFLLRPIQRICQYHLQLNELLKHTEESHTDHKSVVEALETMKSVANKINDTQRQFESLQEVIRFQNSIDGWEGPNLVDRNAVILRKGELVKVTHGRKHKEVFVAVLNKDLIYCKKDFMKKSGYVFDGRIDLNLRMWVNIDSNEEDEFFGMVHNSWRIYSPERRAWILFTAPSPTEKRKWISALEKTKEDITLDPKLREMAVVTTALADSEMISNGNSHGHHSNTLPKSSKKSKGKHLTVTKVDSDAMLIEVGKLKRSTVYTTSNPPHREGTSRFYV